MVCGVCGEWEEGGGEGAEVASSPLAVTSTPESCLQHCMLVQLPECIVTKILLPARVQLQGCHSIRVMATPASQNGDNYCPERVRNLSVMGQASGLIH